MHRGAQKATAGAWATQPFHGQKLGLQGDIVHNLHAEQRSGVTSVMLASQIAPINIRFPHQYFEHPKPPAKHSSSSFQPSSINLGSRAPTPGLGRRGTAAGRLPSLYATRIGAGHMQCRAPNGRRAPARPGGRCSCTPHTHPHHPLELRCAPQSALWEPLLLPQLLLSPLLGPLLSA